MTRLAVLIDADNVGASVAGELFAEIAKHGTPAIKRAYGTKSNLAGWKAELPKHGIESIPVSAHRKGKNSTDSVLIIDAMDLLYENTVEGFVIVSSDSDFTSLAKRLQKGGKTVYGASGHTVSKALSDTCDGFIPLAHRSKLKPLLTAAIRNAPKHDGWAYLGVVGNNLKTAGWVGVGKLSKLVRAESYVEVREVPGVAGVTHLWVKLRT